MKKLVPLLAVATLLALTGCGDLEPVPEEKSALELCVEGKVELWLDIDLYRDAATAKPFAEQECMEQLG